MLPYMRTELGTLEIKARHFSLSARTRTLLLLLESDDLAQLSEDARNKIITPENIDTLLKYQLIEPIETRVNQSTQQQTAVQVELQVLHALQHKLDQTIVPVSTTVSDGTHLNTIASMPTHQVNIPQRVTHPPVIASIPAPVAPLLDFTAIQTLMAEMLQQYGGLMTRRLLTQIQQCQSIAQLRQHQREWLTSLFETRMPKDLLQHCLQQINTSISHHQQAS